MCRMDQSSHQYQKGQLTGHDDPQALCCQSLINKLKDRIIEGWLLINVQLHAITNSKYRQLLSFAVLR